MSKKTAGVTRRKRDTCFQIIWRGAWSVFGIRKHESSGVREIHVLVGFVVICRLINQAKGLNLNMTDLDI